MEKNEDDLKKKMEKKWRQPEMKNEDDLKKWKKWRRPQKNEDDLKKQKI